MSIFNHFNSLSNPISVLTSFIKQKESPQSTESPQVAEKHFRQQSTAQHQPRFFAKTKTGSKIDARAKAGDFQQVNNGKVKLIYKRVIEKNGKLELDSDNVVYRPRKFYHQAELNGEVDKASKIKAALTRQKVTGETNIQTELSSRAGIGIDAPAAIGDLESVNLQDLSMQTRLDLARQVIRGMNNMHKAGYVTGDAKLENILVFKDKKTGRLIARISDFGKAEKCGAEETLRIQGNVRYTGPEKVLSRRSELFSTGLMVLQILAPGLSLEQFEKGEIEHRKGVEAQLMHAGRPNHKGISDYLGYWATHIKAKISKDQSLENTKRDESVVHQYADTLIKDHDPDDNPIFEAIHVVKELTRANPKERMSLDEAEKRFAGIVERSHVSQATRF